MPILKLLTSTGPFLWLSQRFFTNLICFAHWSQWTALRPSFINLWLPFVFLQLEVFPPKSNQEAVKKSFKKTCSPYFPRVVEKGTKNFSADTQAMCKILKAFEKSYAWGFCILFRWEYAFELNETGKNLDIFKNSHYS